MREVIYIYIYKKNNSIYLLDSYNQGFKMVSFRGHQKLGPHPDWSPLGVYFKISDERSCPFHMGFLDYEIDCVIQPALQKM